MPEKGRDPCLIEEGPDTPIVDVADNVENSRSGARPSLPSSVSTALVGEPIAQFAPSGQWWILVIGLGVLAVGVLLLGVALSVRTIRLVPALGFVGVLGGCALVYFGVAAMGRRVVVCEGGFVDCGPFGSRASRWEDVRSIHQTIVRVFNNGKYSHTVHTFGVKLENGKSLTYDDGYDQIALLGRHFQNGIARGRFPLAVAEMNAGKWIDFDEFRVGKMGMECGGDVLPWSDIEKIRADDGLMTVDPARKSTWDPIHVMRIPNLALFAMLVEHLGCKRLLCFDSKGLSLRAD